MELKGGRILVTGGAGYIGSVLVPMMLEKGEQVTVLDKQLPAISTHAQTNQLQAIIGDVRDQAVVKASLENVTSVIYLAGVSDGRAGKANPKLTEEVNVEAFENFVHAAKAAGCRRFVFASTFVVYGYNYQEPLTEDLAPDPQEAYSASKLKAEQILQQLNDFEFQTVSVRSAMVYGSAPRVKMDFIVNRLIHSALTQNTIEVWGGDQVRPQIHVNDISRLFCEMLSYSGQSVAGEVFNACGFNKSILQVAEEIQGILGTSVEINQLPGRANETSFVLNQDKLTQVTGFSAKYTLREAIDAFQRQLFTSKTFA